MLTPPISRLISPHLLGRINLENPHRTMEGLRDDVARPDFFVEQVGRLQRENDQLAQQNGQLRTDNERLKARNTHLETTARQLETGLAQAQGDTQRLRGQNQRLQAENAQLNGVVWQLREQAQRATATARASNADLLDPGGYCRALGIDPRLLRTLPAEKFEKLLSSVFRAYALAHHPDTGGDVEAMKVLNAAYEFLKDPQKRRVYGR